MYQSVIRKSLDQIASINRIYDFEGTLIHRATRDRRIIERDRVRNHESHFAQYGLGPSRHLQRRVSSEPSTGASLRRKYLDQKADTYTQENTSATRSQIACNG